MKQPGDRVAALEGAAVPVWGSADRATRDALAVLFPHTPYKNPG